jgi:hypothetical protein
MEFTLTQEQYEALVALARKGALAEGVEPPRTLEIFLKEIEKKHGITRSFVLVQWQELGQPLPIGTFFPTTWPPQLRQSIELVSRPVAKSDVEAMLAQRARKPFEVLCSRDPSGVLGWTPIDQFFLT